jgi:hypothetical protein
MYTYRIHFIYAADLMLNGIAMFAKDLETATLFSSVDALAVLTDSLFSVCYFV